MKVAKRSRRILLGTTIVAVAVVVGTAALSTAQGGQPGEHVAVTATAHGTAVLTGTNGSTVTLTVSSETVPASGEKSSVYRFDFEDGLAWGIAQRDECDRITPGLHRADERGIAIVETEMANTFSIVDPTTGEVLPDERWEIEELGGTLIVVDVADESGQSMIELVSSDPEAWSVPPCPFAKGQ